MLPAPAVPRKNRARRCSWAASPREGSTRLDASDQDWALKPKRTASGVTASVNISVNRSGSATMEPTATTAITPRPHQPHNFTGNRSLVRKPLHPRPSRSQPPARDGLSLWVVVSAGAPQAGCLARNGTLGCMDPPITQSASPTPRRAPRLAGHSRHGRSSEDSIAYEPRCWASAAAILTVSERRTSAADSRRGLRTCGVRVAGAVGATTAPASSDLAVGWRYACGLRLRRRGLPCA